MARLGFRTSLAPLALAAFALAAPARADEVDLTESGRPTSHKPATLVVLAEAGANYSAFGNLGGALSYYNDFADAEVEAGAGAGFPGLQFGGYLRKLRHPSRSKRLRSFVEN